MSRYIHLSDKYLRTEGVSDLKDTRSRNTSWTNSTSPDRELQGGHADLMRSNRKRSTLVCSIYFTSGGDLVVVVAGAAVEAVVGGLADKVDTKGDDGDA